MTLKIRIDGTTYEGTGEAIMDQLRLSAFDPTEHPDAQSYLQQLRANFIRSTGLDCPLPDGRGQSSPVVRIKLARSCWR